MQVQTQAPQIRTLLDSSNNFYQDLLGYKPEQTSLEKISESQWNEFSKTRGLNPNSSGVYLPRNQKSIIREENPLSLFHEYFGHGLYCEQSLTGRRLVELEKKLLEEEKKEFSKGKYLICTASENLRSLSGGIGAIYGSPSSLLKLVWIILVLLVVLSMVLFLIQPFSF